MGNWTAVLVLVGTSPRTTHRSPLSRLSPSVAPPTCSHCVSQLEPRRGAAFEEHRPRGVEATLKSGAAHRWRGRRASPSAQPLPNGAKFEGRRAAAAVAQLRVFLAILPGEKYCLLSIWPPLNAPMVRKGGLACGWSSSCSFSSRSFPSVLECLKGKVPILGFSYAHGRPTDGTALVAGQRQLARAGARRGQWGATSGCGCGRSR